ncbi:hypothetical protein [Wolbachia endosymbiont of Chironomus riparius]|uniref:hypothetical protein n=1 Tax=Wolbachia endosymbiont of Chironomus riparius TaxID=2883238 RepID=UPI00209F5AF2|nr:hypothetical protein [Wolbachia endosymbiont of Chironomus riparius]
MNSINNNKKESQCDKYSDLLHLQPKEDITSKKNASSLSLHSLSQNKKPKLVNRVYSFFKKNDKHINEFITNNQKVADTNSKRSNKLKESFVFYTKNETEYEKESTTPSSELRDTTFAPNKSHLLGVTTIDDSGFHTDL